MHACYSDWLIGRYFNPFYPTLDAPQPVTAAPHPPPVSAPVSKASPPPPPPPVAVGDRPKLKKQRRFSPPPPAVIPYGALDVFQYHVPPTVQITGRDLDSIMLCAHDLMLPDFATLHTRMLLLAWEAGLDSISEESAKLLLLSLQASCSFSCTLEELYECVMNIEMDPTLQGRSASAVQHTAAPCMPLAVHVPRQIDNVPSLNDLVLFISVIATSQGVFKPLLQAWNRIYILSFLYDFMSIELPEECASNIDSSPV